MFGWVRARYRDVSMERDVTHSHTDYCSLFPDSADPGVGTSRHEPVSDGTGDVQKAFARDDH